MLNPYLWIVIIGGFICFLVACGNGANDLANAFGTSYGSRVLTMLQIVVIATCCEFVGAVVLGSNVATTMSSGVASSAAFKDDPYVLMYGHLCALGASFIWLGLATWKDLPVSSHHAIAGGIIGFALVFGGGNAVNWAGHKDTFPFVSGVVPIVVSWFISPLLAGIVASIFYVAVRFLILQRENCVQIAPYTLPAVVLVTFFLEFLFVFMIAAGSKLGWTVAHSAWMAAVVGAAAAVLSVPLIWVLKRRVAAMERQAEARAEESGISFMEAMREILAGGRPLGRDPEAAAVASRRKKAQALHDDSFEISEYDTLHRGDEAAEAVQLQQRRRRRGSAGPSRFTPTKTLDEQREADGAVVPDEEEDSDSDDRNNNNNNKSNENSNSHSAAAAASFAMEPFQFESAAANASGRRLRGGNSGLVTLGENNNNEEEDSGNTASDENPRTKGMNIGGGGGAVVEETCEEEDDGYVYVDGMRHGSHGGLYDRNNVRIFDPRAEYMFRYLQVFTAACTSLAHGSNDVSNSIGPFSAIYDIYVYRSARAKADVPVWVLCLGGAGIVVGLATYGLNIMRLLGEKIALITPFRGFCAELATALVVSFATTYGLPISSTHCITGAVVAISMMDVGIKKVKWGMVLKMYVGWIATLVITAVMSACFFAQGVNSPIEHMQVHD